MNLIFGAESSVALGNVGCLSPDGISYSFDHRANGYSRGEGIGVVILKPLSRAVDDGDTIRAVIRATGTNHDGRTPDIAQPRQAAQEAMIRDTYNSADLGMEPTRYVEAHGTGTGVGDPIEIAALHSSFASVRSKEDPLYAGALKSNIGHTEACSGIASLIKTVMVLENAVIPGNVWFEEPSPNIDMGSGMIKVGSVHFSTTSAHSNSFQYFQLPGQRMACVALPSAATDSVEPMPTRSSTTQTIICRKMVSPGVTTL